MDSEELLSQLGGRVRAVVESEAAGEPVLAVLSGREKQAAVLTPHRLILAQGGFVMRGGQSVRVNDVVSISSGLTDMHIALSNGSEADLPFWPTQIENAKKFVAAFHAAQAGLAAPAQSASSVSVADELAKLSQLRDQGVLSDEEFQAQKASVLAHS